MSMAAVAVRNKRKHQAQLQEQQQKSVAGTPKQQQSEQQSEPQNEQPAGKRVDFKGRASLDSQKINESLASLNSELVKITFYFSNPVNVSSLLSLKQKFWTVEGNKSHCETRHQNNLKTSTYIT